MTASSRSVLVLLNPHAANGATLRWQPRIQAALLAMGVEAEIYVTHSLDDSRQHLALQPGRRVVLVGGDDTISPLLPDLLAHKHSLGVVPAGTGNDLARALGVLHLDLEDALRHAVLSPAQPMDVGQVRWSATPPVDANATPPASAIHTALFASSLTVGFDSVVAYRAQTSRRYLPGQLHYLWATLAELRVLTTWPIRFGGLPAKDTTAPAAQPPALHLASVLNTITYGSGMPIAPHAKIDDGMLHLLRLRQLPRPRLLWALQQMLRGQHIGHPAVQMDDVQHLTLQCDKPLPLGTDGNFIGQARWVQVDCLPGVLPMVRGDAKTTSK